MRLHIQGTKMNQVRDVFKNQLADNITSLYLLQGMNYIIPMAVLPYLVRVLGMEVYGLVAFSQAFAQYFIMLTDYGFNLSATRYIAQRRDDLRAISSMFWQVLILKTGLMLLGLAILLITSIAVPHLRQDAAYFLLAFLAVAGNVLFPQWYFQGIEKMRYISVITGIAKIVSTALLFIFVHTPADGLRAVGILSSGMIIAGVMGTFAALRAIGLKFEWPSWASLRATLADGWHVFIATASISLYTNTNVFLVGLIAGNVQAGYFSAAEKLIRAMSGLIGPVSQAIYPRISALATHSKDAALALASKSLFWMGAVSLSFSLAMFVLARLVATLFFGVAATGSVPIMRWIALLPFLIAISNVLGIQTMLTFGLDKQFSRILIVFGILNVAVGVPLIYWSGAQGAGIAVLITEISVTLTMIAVLKKHHILLSYRGVLRREG
jgi:PST family polysaccharide transporter